MADVPEGVPGAEPEPEPAPSAETKHSALNALILEGVMRAYRERLRPLEMKSQFFIMNQLLSDAEFSAPPSVLLVG